MLWFFVLILPFVYAQRDICPCVHVVHVRDGCPQIDMPDCNWEAGEIRCPSTYDDNGCPTEGFCQPKDSETNCSPTCPVTECKEGEILFDGEWDAYSNCLMQDYCAVPTPRCHKPEDEFEVVTPGYCSDEGLKWCNQGWSYYGCWLGAYCAVDCVTLE